MREGLTVEDVSIVLLGSFNPPIFHPSWFAMHGLISGEEAESASNVIVAQEVAQFSAAYMAFDIQPSRFFVRTAAIYRDVVKDLVLAALGERLPHTPVWAVGLNKSFEFKCRDELARARLGAKLAPPSAWGEWGRAIDKSIFAGGEHGGVTRVTMQQRPRPDERQGHVQADLHANMNDRTGTGVFLDVNNHFDVGPAATIIGNNLALDVVSECWSSSLASADVILDGVMAVANAE